MSKKAISVIKPKIQTGQILKDSITNLPSGVSVAVIEDETNQDYKIDDFLDYNDGDFHDDADFDLDLFDENDILDWDQVQDKLNLLKKSTGSIHKSSNSLQDVDIANITVRQMPIQGVIYWVGVEKPFIYKTETFNKIGLILPNREIEWYANTFLDVR